MAKPLPPVPIAPDRPGISKKFSKLALADRWIDSDKILFVDGKPEKMPGWNKKTVTSVGAAIRGVLTWSTSNLSSFTAMGTYRRLYVVDSSDEPFNITPIASTGTLTDPFTVETALSTVIVEHAAHGRQVGDEAIFANAGPIGTTGMTIDGAYPITSVIDDDHYAIEHSVASLGDDTGGGTVDYEYELATGTDDPSEGDGYGAGGYGLYDYGAPTEDADISVIFEPRVWSLVKVGDLIYANPVNGGIYVFDPDDTPAYQRAVALANAPTVCRVLFMTPERFPFALGVDNDPMNIKWPDQDDHTNWTPGSTSTANSRRLQEGNRLIGGIGIGNGISGVWSDTALYRFQYTGGAFIYDSALVGTNCGLVSPMAVIAHQGVAYWMSRHGFHMWGGGSATQYMPNSEDITESVVRALRGAGFEFKCNSYFSQRYNCIMWFYVADSDTEPGLYVCVSLDDFSWVVGTLERTSGASGIDQRPVLGAVDGYLYQHEDGLDADGEIMEAFIERAPLQIAGGTVLGEIQGIVTDMQRQTGDMTFEITTRDRINQAPMDTEIVTFSPGEDLIDPLIGGRIAGIVIRSAELGGDFRIGAPTLEVKATGKQR